MLGCMGTAGAGPLDLSFRGPVGTGLPTPPVVVTTNVMSRVTAFPNYSAKQAGYIVAADSSGTINQGNTGEAVKWAFIRKNSPTTVYYDTSAPYQSCYLYTDANDTEDDRTFQGSAPLTFIWVSANGLVPGMKVNRANLMLNFGAFAGMTIPAGGQIVARLDTIPADYAMVSTSVSVYGADTDVARMDISWNEVNANGNVNWSPSLDSRDDYHDFGPRSDNGAPAGVYASGAAMNISVKSAVQWALDLAHKKGQTSVPTGGFLFVVYANGGTWGAFPTFSAGDYNQWVGQAGGKGCPVFTCEAETPRGTMAWGGNGSPVCITLDDCFDDHIAYAPSFVTQNLRFTSAIYSDAFNNNADYNTFMTNFSPYVDILHHGKTHVGWGSVAGAALNAELEKGAWYSSTYYATPPDTSLIDHAAWTGGTQQYYGVEAMPKMVSYGYKSCRAFGIKTAGTHPVGAITPLSWTDPCNVYLIGSVFAPNIFSNGGSPGNYAYVLEELTDQVDLMWTTYGKAALNIYAHRDTDGITATNLGYAIAIARDLDSCEPMDYYQMMEWRLADTSFIDPADITTANGYTAVQQFSAAILDSMRDAHSTVPLGTNATKLWVTGKDQ